MSQLKNRGNSLSSDNRSKSFKTKLEKHKNELIIKDYISKAWNTSVKCKHNQEICHCKYSANPYLNRNVTMNLQRAEHRKDISYNYKRIINYLEQENLDNNRNGVATVIDRRLFKVADNVERKKDDIFYKNINEISPSIESKYIRSRRQIELGEFIYGTNFQTFLGLVIILNSIMLGLQAEGVFKKNNLYNISQSFDSFANAVFLLEIILKWIYGFNTFWYSVWNVFDCILVATSLLSILYEHSKSATASQLFRIFRIFRALRSLRSISIFYKLQIIMNTVVKSITDMVNIVFLMFMIMLMFALLGCNLFHSSAPAYFKDLHTGLMSLFYCTTREHLTNLFKAVPENDPTHTYWNIFLTVAIIILAFILTNLVVAVVVTNMEQAFKDNEKEINIRNHLKSIEGKSEARNVHDSDLETLFAERLNIIKVDDAVKGFSWSIQAPVENSILQDLDINHLETYFLILDALEQSYHEYTNIKRNLQQMIDIVQDLSEKHSEMQKTLTEMLNDENLRNDLKEKMKIQNWSQIGRRGDILTDLINLEKMNAFSSEFVFDFQAMSRAVINITEEINKNEVLERFSVVRPSYIEEETPIDNPNDDEHVSRLENLIIVNEKKSNI